MKITDTNALKQKGTKITERLTISLFQIILLFVCLAYFAGRLHAQTTLSGDHIITGNLDVGASGTSKNLNVAGLIKSDNYFEKNATTGWLVRSGVTGLRQTGFGIADYNTVPGGGSYYPFIQTRSNIDGTRKWFFGHGAIYFKDGSNNDPVFVNGTDGTSPTLAMSLSTSGNFGIGTISPSSKLTVENALNQNTLYIKNTYGSPNTSIAVIERVNNVNSANQTPDRASLIIKEGGGYPLWITNALGTANHLALNPAGDLGIGTSTPSARLDVNGNAAIRGTLSFFTSSNPTTPSIVFDPETSQITAGGQPLLAPNANGYVGIGTASPARRLDVASDGSNWISGTFSGAGGTDKIVTGNLANRATLGAHDSTLSTWSNLTLNGDWNGNFGNVLVPGNVGIGSATPTAKLEVTGQTGNTAAPGIKVTGDGGVLFEGTFGAGLIPATGAGTRFMWYPKKAALRAGTVSNASYASDLWIGDYSVAFGLNSLASGLNSSAMSGGEAEGANSAAMSGGLASGPNSAAMSGGRATNSNSTAMSSGEAGGLNSTAMSGGFTSPEFSGEYSTAMSGGEAWAAYSTAISGGVAFGGSYSTAMSGGFTQGKNSIAAGPTFANSAYSFVIGRCNAGDNESTETWVESDPLFVIGNGPDWDNPQNAFVVNKNASLRAAGKAEFKAGARVAPQGDLSMGDFTAGQNPAALSNALKYSGE